MSKKTPSLKSKFTSNIKHSYVLRNF
uniref:Uncharacterized protein n=1 Tax=Arundo donax TaxID=35708 RepID=A0A0A9B7T5_ARUDO